MSTIVPQQATPDVVTMGTAVCAMLQLLVRLQLQAHNFQLWQGCMSLTHSQWQHRCCHALNSSHLTFTAQRIVPR
jgi:hypothetical protein